MTRLIIRRAETHDAEGIARICAAGWRDTYRGLKEPERIEAVIAEYYAPERIRREIAAPVGWDRGSRGREGDRCRRRWLDRAGASARSSSSTSTRRGAGRGSARIFSTRSPSSSGRGAREQWVSVEPDNRKGLPFYYARGFEVRGHLAEEGHVSLRLMRRLEP
jgi:hypothetical protein